MPTMVRAGGLLLLLNGVWNLAVWPPFLRRVQRDPRAHDEQGRATPFLRVHLILTATAGALALVSLVLGGRLTARP